LFDALTQWASRGDSHIASQRLPFDDVLHELPVLSDELTLEVVRPLTEWVTVEELFEVIELVAPPLEPPASTVFPRPSEMDAPAANAPDVQTTSASAVKRCLMKSLLSEWAVIRSSFYA
jgi:hypothetical protein